ncbi:phytochromobilin:ferredoxin oxidoreductase, chloroplastic isoform X2 [Cryptomeria japonica]|uniref:phytochromobilin:ferredoxin oxidoreductase, chloroplastic isoform X2 n=1 Tax=Cryptomeria japonica TaxID=3369 RepID=UPI0027DA4739|nr:phytochromobilin:ferredoxin oxidoreductase, chloroplastic isoform X2 [Cryptomeria japonica]
MEVAAKYSALISVNSQQVQMSCKRRFHMRSRSRSRMRISSLYNEFAEFGIQEARKHTHIHPFPVEDKFRNMTAIDGKTTLHTEAFQSSKIRFLRSLLIDDNDSMKVFDFAVFPKPEYDLPIFCANFFSTVNMNIIVLDLNPLYVTHNEEYKKKYYSNLMPLAQKYTELLPWGDKITSESLKFFSPIVIWTKFAASKYKQDVLYSAFMDYFTAWLNLMDESTPEKNAVKILSNKEAQHQYLLWRATKDPGHPILKRLLGDSLSEEFISDFLFNGALTLGDKRFLDFFPEYKCADGTINKKRSMAGKSFSKRPWNEDGSLIEM